MVVDTEVLVERIRSFIDDDRAAQMLGKYYSGSYTGALFDIAPSLRSDEPNRLTAHDMAAVATLSVPLSGRAVAGLVDRSDELAEKLKQVPDIDLAQADDDALSALYRLQGAVDEIDDIGHVTRSKLLAHKRPRLVPIRDQHVLGALMGVDHGPFTEPLRAALRADERIIEGLDELARGANLSGLSPLRVLDVVVWMTAYGNAQVPD